MTIDLVLITYNRREYTQRALASILADHSADFGLTIWDNASTDGTAQYLREEVSDPRIRKIVYCRENVGQIKALNQVWTESKADLLGKLDNDCLVSPGWLRTLAQAHQDIAELGVVACWHYFPEDFDLARAQHKIQQFGPHQILRHPWTCGTGFLVKSSTYRRLGPLRGEGTTPYWMRMAKGGYVNGFYYPLVFQEHMDDLRSPHNRCRQMSFEEAYRTSDTWKRGMIKDYESYRALNEKIVNVLLDGPYDYRHYETSLPQRLWRRLRKVLAK
jgi:glycosyltransferase involved in cell wall biosynthesis